MNHTYFFKTMEWAAVGTYYDGKGDDFPLYGEVSIIHNKKEWSLGGFLEVRYPEPVRFHNDYIIAKTDSETTLSWESYNPSLGTLNGTFEIIGNSIISFYQSEDGTYSGTETLVRKNPHSYYNVGVSFYNGKKMSSWTAFLSVKE